MKIRTKQLNEPVLDTSGLFIFNKPKTLWQRIMAALREIFR